MMCVCGCAYRPLLRWNDLKHGTVVVLDMMPQPLNLGSKVNGQWLELLLRFGVGADLHLQREHIPAGTLLCT